MAEHRERLRVLHGPHDVFTLVADVRDYPNFIRFIQAMRITGERELGEGVRALTAEAMVGYKFVRERFATDVRLDEPNRAIDVDFRAGPFSHLENQWRFTELSDGSTLVDFWIRYQFKNRILQRLLQANFTRATGFLVGAFEKRAQERFPKAGDPKADAGALIAAARQAEREQAQAPR